MIYNYRSNVFTNALYGANDPNVIHIIYFTDPLKTPLTNATTTLNTELQAELIKNTTEQTIETKNYVTYSIKSKMLYTITIINSDARVVSLISNSYMDQFKNALLNSVSQHYVDRCKFLVYVTDGLGRLSDPSVESDPNVH